MKIKVILLVSLALSECLAYGSTESVKIAIEYNFSKQYQSTKPWVGAGFWR